MIVIKKRLSKEEQEVRDRKLWKKKMRVNNLQRKANYELSARKYKFNLRQWQRKRFRKPRKKRDAPIALRKKIVKGIIIKLKEKRTLRWCVYCRRSYHALHEEHLLHLRKCSHGRKKRAMRLFGWRKSSASNPIMSSGKPTIYRGGSPSLGKKSR